MKLKALSLFLSFLFLSHSGLAVTQQACLIDLAGEDGVLLDRTERALNKETQQALLKELAQARPDVNFEQLKRVEKRGVRFWVDAKDNIVIARTVGQGTKQRGLRSDNDPRITTNSIQAILDKLKIELDLKTLVRRQRGDVVEFTTVNNVVVVSKRKYENGVTLYSTKKSEQGRDNVRVGKFIAAWEDSSPRIDTYEIFGKDGLISRIKLDFRYHLFAHKKGALVETDYVTGNTPFVSAIERFDPAITSKSISAPSKAEQKQRTQLRNLQRFRRELQKTANEFDSELDEEDVVIPQRLVVPAQNSIKKRTTEHTTGPRLREVRIYRAPTIEDDSFNLEDRLYREIHIRGQNSTRVNYTLSGRMLTSVYHIDGDTLFFMRVGTDIYRSLNGSDMQLVDPSEHRRRFETMVRQNYPVNPNQISSNRLRNVLPKDQPQALLLGSEASVRSITYIVEPSAVSSMGVYPAQVISVNRFPQ